ncbi:MAG: HAD family hydrolase, partial [Dehalococcoidia bacterium]|nr:HAD family hydrolase [Dehalococcoidia bacterium]
MNKAVNIKVVSLDLFGTLVDVRRGLEPAWNTILGDANSDSLKRKYWDRATEILRDKLLVAGDGNGWFKNIRSVFEDAFRDFFNETHLDFNPQTAAELWILGHRSSYYYPDASVFMSEIFRKHLVCLSSDTSMEMVPGIIETQRFDSIFISEDMRCYKTSSVYWNYIVQHYGFHAASILHIGDASADVIGAKECGIVTCW